MEAFVHCLLVALAVFLAVPVIMFTLEVMAAIALPHREGTLRPSQYSRRRVAVIVPAHNEGTGLLPTLEDIKRQLRSGDRLLVVADNCTDDTAAVAAAAGGVEVAERHDPSRIGKGYALDFGLQHLSSDPPDIVIIVDADCRLAADTIDQLAWACAMSHRPVQGLYLMTAPDGSRINYQVAEFAWRVKNWLRPLGLSVVNLPCQLVGTGMAFPWDVIRSADLANECIVEDMKLGLDLALAGHPPLFCPSASVRSQFASSVEGAGIQRKRWEQGHIQTIRKFVPYLMYEGIARRNRGLLALGLDIAVPPLSLLAMLVVGMVVIGVLAALLGSSAAALIISAASLICFIAATSLAWVKCGQDVLPPGAILLIIPYVIEKIGLYGYILSGRAHAPWIRTDRSKT